MTATPDNDEPGPFVCPECRCHCTRSPTNPAVEYGHARAVQNSHHEGRCSRRPACVDTKRTKPGTRADIDTAPRDGDGRFLTVAGERERAIGSTRHERLTA